MSGIVGHVRRSVREECFATECRRGKCSLKLDGVPPDRLVVDLDCDGMPEWGDRRRCDYVLVAEGPPACIVPIELKGGRFRGDHALDQLQGGLEALRLSSWVSGRADWGLVPVIGHAKRIHREELKRLRRRKVRLGGRIAQAELLRCGQSLGDAIWSRSPV